MARLTDASRSAMVTAVTDAVLDAEEGIRPRDPMRVRVFCTEVPEGTWGGNGQMHTHIRTSMHHRYRSFIVNIASASVSVITLATIIGQAPSNSP